MLYGSIYLLDVTNQTRLSETFQFSTAPGALTGIGKRIVFEVTNAHPEVAVFLRLEKYFEGDVSSWLDTYAKGKPNPEDKTKRGYRQPFGWYSFHVFDEGYLSDTAMQHKERDITMDWFWKQEDNRVSDADLCAQVMAMRSKAGSKKPRSVPVKFGMKLREVEFRFQPAAQQVQELQTEIGTLITATGEILTLVEMEEFLPAHNKVVPVEQRGTNDLYCWPISANVTKGNAKWKNIAIKVQLASTDKISAPGRILKVRV